MKYQGRQIDHIVYAVKNMNTALDSIEHQLGVRPIFGGRHLNKGTKNALLNLGNACYLEILSIDEENKNIPAPRWMGIDLIENSCITRWALKSNQLEEDRNILNNYDPSLSEVFQGERQTEKGSILKWKMLLPKAEPKIELAPFMVDWSNSVEHPTLGLSNLCSLEEIKFKAPKEQLSIRNCFNSLFDKVLIQESKKEQISIIIKGPKGLLIL